VALGVGGQIKTLSTILTLKGLVVVATKEVKEAAQVAKEANTRATLANTNISMPTKIL
jgi:hypothetical protein